NADVFPQPEDALTAAGTEVAVEAVVPRLVGDAVVDTADAAFPDAWLELERHAPIDTAYARTITRATFLCTPSSGTFRGPVPIAGAQARAFAPPLAAAAT